MHMNFYDLSGGSMTTNKEGTTGNLALSNSQEKVSETD